MTQVEKNLCMMYTFAELCDFLPHICTNSIESAWNDTSTIQISSNNVSTRSIVYKLADWAQNIAEDRLILDYTYTTAGSA